MKRSVNAHFGEFYSAEKVHFIGSENAKVAQRVVRLARQQGADRFDASTFSPTAAECPAPPRKRKRAEAADEDFDNTSDEDEGAGGVNSDWKQAMLSKIAHNELPTVACGSAPKSVRKAAHKMARCSGNDEVL